MIGGLWQAAKALSLFIPGERRKEDVFRLSLDASSKGVFVFPLSLNGEDYSIALIFNDTVNPSLLKNKLRLLKNYLKDCEKELIVEEEKKSGDLGQRLFQDITEEEMDALFSIQPSDGN